MSASTEQLEQALGLLPATDQIIIGQLVGVIADISARLDDCITAIGLLNQVDTMRAEQIAVLRHEMRLIMDAADAPAARAVASRAYWNELAELRARREEASDGA